MSKFFISNTIKAVKKVDNLLVGAKFVRDDFISSGIDRNKISLVNHPGSGGYSEFRPKERSTDEFRVLFLAQNSLIKGTGYLLESWKNLNLKNSKLTIGGSQHPGLIKNYKNKVDFEYLGPIYDKIHRKYQQSSVYVLPSLGDPAPRTVLEAMNCGIPVIISERTGTADFIEDGKEGFVVPIRDSKSISDKLQYFHDNPSEIKRMGKNAREMALKYTWENFSDEVSRNLVTKNSNQKV